MKKLTVFLLCAALLAAALTGCGSKKEDEAPADGSGTEASADSISTEAPADTDAEKPAEDPEQTDGSLLTGLHHAEIEIENYGTISLELDADAAPISVTNFIDLAKNGFYDEIGRAHV